MYYLNERQLALKKELRSFVDSEIAPLAAKLDASGVYPAELVRRICEKGYCGLPFPREMGGMGYGVL